MPILVSTHLFVNQRLHTALFDRMLQAGADGFEIFCARQSFDYTRPGEMESQAALFGVNYSFRSTTIKIPEECIG